MLWVTVRGFLERDQGITVKSTRKCKHAHKFSQGEEHHIHAYRHNFHVFLFAVQFSFRSKHFLLATKLADNHNPAVLDQ